MVFTSTTETKKAPVGTFRSAQGRCPHHAVVRQFGDELNRSRILKLHPTQLAPSARPGFSHRRAGRLEVLRGEGVDLTVADKRSAHLLAVATSWFIRHVSMIAGSLLELSRHVGDLHISGLAAPGMWPPPLRSAAALFSHHTRLHGRLSWAFGAGWVECHPSGGTVGLAVEDRGVYHQVSCAVQAELDQMDSSSNQKTV